LETEEVNREDYRGGERECKRKRWWAVRSLQDSDCNGGCGKLCWGDGEILDEAMWSRGGVYAGGVAGCHCDHRGADCDIAADVVQGAAAGAAGAMCEQPAAVGVCVCAVWDREQGVFSVQRADNSWGSG